MIFNLSQSIDYIVREQISRQSHVSHMGKGMSVVVGNGGKGVQAVNKLSMFGLYEGTGSREHGVGIGGITVVGTGADAGVGGMAHKFVGVGGMASVGTGSGRACLGQSGML